MDDTTTAKDLILVVDDNMRNVQVLSSILDSNGYEVAVATSGSQALEFTSQTKPELILLDVMMPEMDGYETCRLLKADPLRKQLPIIFLTAKAETSDLVEGFEAGGVDYVTKPFNATELLLRIKTHVELKKAREAIQTLSGLIPICCQCKKIRDGDNYWSAVEAYVERHSNASFSHGYCPDCAAKEMEKLKAWKLEMQAE